MWPKITTNYSPNFSPIKRTKNTIKFIILHYTGMKKESHAIQRLCDYKSKVSSHYFLKKNGEILRLVPDLYIAWHAGKSRWSKFISLNKYSIGIEIQNSGHNNSHENFSHKQIESLKKLLKKLAKIYKIRSKNILGHSDIAPERKRDPGEKFPWIKLTKLKLVHSCDLNVKTLKKMRLVKIGDKEKEKFFKNLSRIGYNKVPLLSKDQNNKILTKAFQRRYRQALINGKIDKECLLISKNL